MNLGILYGAISSCTESSQSSKETRGLRVCENTYYITDFETECEGEHEGEVVSYSYNASCPSPLQGGFGTLGPKTPDCFLGRASSANRMGFGRTPKFQTLGDF